MLVNQSHTMKNYIRFLFCFLAINAFAQPSSNFNTSRNWSLNKKEFFFGIGGTNFTGDLGGRDKIGTDFSLVDLDWPATFAGFNIGYRYRWHPFWATSTELYSGMVQGSDENTNEIIRRSRNLHFRSPIVQLTQRIEWILLANEKIGRRYNIPGLKGFKNQMQQVYLFTGAAVTYFNPQAEINGTWTNLRPLKTEGQGLPGGADEYSRITAVIPFGIGVKIGISDMWRIGLEVSYNKTFTDYIDDVSTNYFDPVVLQSQVGSDAVFAANPSKENQTWFVPGEQRGDPDEKDAFYIANIVFTRNLTYKPPKKQNWRRPQSRTKF